MSRKRVTILYTGGTLGMRPTPDGYAPSGDIDALIRERLPELAESTMPEIEIEASGEPLDSANATPAHWYALAGQIADRRDRSDGFVVIHGTDTLAYTASALSFLLPRDCGPVVLTGSQIPLCEVRTDAQSNLITSLQSIATGRLKEVAVCFGRHVFRGNRITKVDAGELDAFDSPNFSPLAEIGTELRFLEPGGLPGSDPLPVDKVPACHDRRIAVLRLFPGLSPDLIDAVVGSGAVGVVLRCYGAGTAPTADKNFLAALQRATDAGVVVIAVSQCQQGSVSLERYASGSALLDAGVLGGYDMTTEAAFTKLHALLAFGFDPAEVARLSSTNLRGELARR